MDDAWRQHCGRHTHQRKDDQLFFSKWHEEPEYREEIVVRKYPTGEITEVIPGSWTQMPNGQIWILQ